MPNTYTTLTRVREYLNMASADTQDDSLLLSLANRASRAIDTYTRRKFYPRTETKFYDLGKPLLQRLDDDLLALTTLKTQNGACTVASGVMWLGCGNAWNRQPYDRIVLDDSSGSVLSFSGTPQRANEVTGTWGYHEAWGEAWVDTGTSLAANYTASAGSLSLAGAGSVGAGASDANYDHPRISVGDLVKVDNEYFEVMGGAASGNGTMLVKPFVNGTTAASHASGTCIVKFLPEPDIAWAALRLSVWAYGQKDAPYQTKTAFPQLGEVSTPAAWPEDVKERVNRFVRRSFQTFPD